MTKLEEFRQGVGGVILFYGYLVAILVVAVLLMVAYQNQEDTVHRLDVQSIRSCQAIEGALEFWRGERGVVVNALNDPNVEGSQRDRYEIRYRNLNRVLEAGDRIDCHDG